MEQEEVTYVILRSNGLLFMKGRANNAGSYWAIHKKDAWVFKTMEMAELTLKNVLEHVEDAAIVDAANCT